MAGGRGSNKQSGNLDRIHQWLCCHQLYASVKPQLPTSETFKKHHRIEKNRIVTKSLSDLQANISRLLYSDSNFSKEEQLLVEHILSTYTSRLAIAPSENKVLDIDERYADGTAADCRSKSTESVGNVRDYAIVDVSPTISDMADSGLETGSVSPHENTTSENSSTDFEELQVTEYASGSDEIAKIRGRRVRNKDQKVVANNERYNTTNNYKTTCHIKDLVESGLMECGSNDNNATCCSFNAEQPLLDSSSSSTDNAQRGKSNADEIFQYENQVLSDPFYESDCASDENESFEFINLGNASSGSQGKNCAKAETAEKLQDEKMCHSSYTQAESTQSDNVNREVSHDTHSQKSSCNTSNYYFIDASTLNDEVEVPTPSIPKSQCYDEKFPPYTSYASKYAANTSNDLVEEQCYKFTPLKTTNLQTGHERTAEFERELKLTEYLEPLDARKMRKTNFTPEDKISAETNKESLVVEIKEADSGESAHPSPCPDNNKNINNDRHVMSRMSNDDNSNVVIEDKEETTEQTNDKDANSSDDTRPPALIRRNTFELDSNDEKLSVLRQEYERRQGNLVFQNAIPQYSGHRVDGDSCFNPPDEPSIPISNVLNKFTMDVQVPSGSQYHTMPYLSLNNEKYDVNQSLPENNNALQNTTKTNMIYPVTKSASDEVVMDYHAELDNDSSNCSNSLPVTLSCIVQKDNRTDTMKKTKCVETMPIISGGVSTSDYSKPTDSPTVRRKTESTPIVSGGSVIMNEFEVKSRPTRMSSSMTAWVVDMSDCNKNEPKLLNNAHAGMSQSFSSSECVKKSVRKMSAHEKHGSLGFFVNLKDMDNKPVAQQQSYTAEKKEQNVCSKSYCEFYVDMSGTNSAPKTKKLEVEEPVVKPEKPIESSDKKNIFSMFIDLSDPPKNKEITAAQHSHRRSFSTFSDKQVEMKLDDTNSSENSITSREDQSSIEQKCAREKTKPSVFMYIESDSPVVRRRTLSSSRPAFKRHSWNVDKTQSVNNNNNNNGHVAKELMFRKEHKRAHSLSVDRGDLKRLQGKPSCSSNSLNDTAKPEFVLQKNSKLAQEGNNGPNNMDTSTEDVFEFDVRDTPPNSHVEVINEELRVSIKEHEYTELKTDRAIENLDANDVKVYEDEYSETSAWEKTCTESTEGQTRKSETFDISSGSGPSPDSDNHDYELSELLNGEVPNINRPQIVPAVGSKISETHKSLNETIKKIESELKSPDYVKSETVYDNITLKKSERTVGHTMKTTTSNFVRLSDLDKTPVISHSTDTLIVKEDRKYRMCKSIPETSWIESKLVMSITNGSVRSVPRKFTSVMSTSLPPKQKSPLEELTGEYDGEGIISESDLSSMQSSMGRSGAEGSTEETETSSLAGSRPYNRLGEDLLRMFLEEINPDVTIDVGGRRIRAHKCILSSRCQYFAAILSGGWIESVGNVISLQGYSYDAVHFALRHIYSGESNIPDSISIVELATLADMLCLEGLKEIIGYTLKVKYCHLFHKPCQICAVGVLECMPLAAAYGLDEVYRKSLRWVTRHFVRIWPCKAFATLPKELMAKCYHQHIVHMSTDNVLQTMMDCDKLLATLPNVRWAEPVFRMVSNLLETSVKFLSDNFSGVLGNENFQSLGRELTWNISRLEDNFLAAAERLPPEQACKSYTKLHKMLTSAQQDEVQEKIKWGPLFVDFLKKIQSRVEKCLVRDAARAARTSTWLKMDLELRRRIQELACLVILPNETSRRPSRHSNSIKEPRPQSNRSTTANRSLDLKRVKMVISEHNHKTLKQMAATQQQQPKKVFNKPKSDPLERKMQNDKQATTHTDTNRPKSWPNKLEVKSRYLEPRNKSVPKETTQPVHQEKVMAQQRRKIMISSSDSSRTSSPAMKRATEKKPLTKIKLPIKKDVKALSSDSLTESNVTRTNAKKDSISKSCGITRPESPSFKQKSTEIGLSVDSLAESKNKPAVVKKKANKMDTSMSTDSLMTEVTTPKSNASNKLSPTLGKTTNKAQPYEKTIKKTSPPMQQRSPLTATRRPRRSLESSTAASRSRAAAISAYHLRRNLLDAAKTPDIPSKSLNNVSSKPVNTRLVAQSTINHPNIPREKKEGVPNQQGSESPSKRSSPKSSGTNKMNKPTVTNKRITSTTKVPCDEKGKSKCHNGEVPKQPTVGSRSGTFLKDEPTILKKADVKSSQINT